MFLNYYQAKCNFVHKFTFKTMSPMLYSTNNFNIYHYPFFNLPVRCPCKHDKILNLFMTYKLNF